MTTSNQVEPWVLEKVDAVIRRELEVKFPSLVEEQEHTFRLAINEAEALAWQTGYPELVLPELAREKVNRLAEWNERQKKILHKSERSLALAA